MSSSGAVDEIGKRGISHCHIVSFAHRGLLFTIRQHMETPCPDTGRWGFTVSQVAHDYGDVCQSITELVNLPNVGCVFTIDLPRCAA